MSEGAGQLDLTILDQDVDYSVLRPTWKKKAIYDRNSGRLFLLFTILGVVASFIRWIDVGLTGYWISPVLIMLIVLFSVRREQIKEIYALDENGLIIPNMWFYRKTIPYEQIIRVLDDNIEEEQSGKKYGAIRILVDSPLIKLNVTGLQTSNILLTTMSYDSIDLNRFADEIMRRKREVNITPNTLAQRLTDQVNRAWDNRWKLILFNVIDGATEGLLFLGIIELIIWGFFGVSTWPLLGGLLFSLLILVLLFIQLIAKPKAIIGIRPHELGPLLYDEEELITSVRFIVMCRPFTVHLKHCEMIYPDDVAKQVGRLNQIQPEFVESGELTYGIAQMVGNHSKAKGAILTFTYKETEDKSLREYQIPIEWG